MYNRVFPQPDDNEPSTGHPFAPILRHLKGERLAEVNIRYESGITLRVQFPPDDEEDDDTE